MNRAQRRLAQKPHRGAGGVAQAFGQAQRQHQAGRLEEAAQGYRQVLAAAPRHADSLHLLGVVAYQQGHHEAAAAWIGRAIAIDPQVALYHCNLGNALQAQGQAEAAIGCFQQALALQPGCAEFHYNLGNAWRAQGALAAAAEAYRAALALRPEYAEAQCNLGLVLRAQGLPTQAIAGFRAALALRPGLAVAHTGLGQAWQDMGRPEAALACFQAALALQPEDGPAHGHLGCVLADLGRLDEACAALRTAVRLRPDHAESHFNLATALLTRGDFAEGWAEYEWRWQTPQMQARRRDFAQPQWRGEAAAGARLLVHAEQGFGDTLQFCRLAPLAAARGLAVTLEVQPALARLLRGLPGVAQVIARGAALPAFDLHCPLLSLPGALGITAASIPAATPYLHAEAAAVALWAGRLAAREAARVPRVGLAWAGSPTLLADRRRSLEPSLLAPLLAVEGVHWVSLQKDRAGAALPLTDLMGEVGDFADTAALVANLDLVIAADTAVAHLAAALGRPVWLLNRTDSCWRWLAGRRDSPWYPTLRVYRQPRPGAWEAVIAEVAEDLRG